MSKKTLTKHIVNLTKENFIKFDDQQKVLQIVNEAILQYKEELKTSIATTCHGCGMGVHVFPDDVTKLIEA